VAIITLNRPASLNGWTTALGDEVKHAIWQAEQDPRVVGIVVTGAGRAFCAGADMKMLSSIVEGDSAAALASSDEYAVPPLSPELAEEFDGNFTYLMAGTKPVIAAINGPVAGMAVPFVLCCDIRFMADDAVLLTAFSHRGLVAEWGLSWLLPRAVGAGVALDLLFSSRKVTGVEAARIGLVNASMRGDELLPYAIGYVQQLAAHASPVSLALMKRQVYSQLHVGLGRAEAESQRLMLESFGRPDFAEGVASFLEKRPPNFTRLPAP
jgi:enoyl-CoA hydratase/carnithine racemase